MPMTDKWLNDLRSQVYKGLDKDIVLGLIDEVQALRSSIQTMDCSRRGAFNHASFQHSLCQACTARRHFGLEEKEDVVSPPKDTMRSRDHCGHGVLKEEICPDCEAITREYYRTAPCFEHKGFKQDCGCS
jgi:hypothetical protein